MTKINDYGASVEFPDGRDYAIEKFIELILEKAPRYENFIIADLDKKLDLNELELKQYKYLTFDLRVILINKGLVEVAPSSNIYVKLTEAGKTYFDEKKTIRKKQHMKIKEETLYKYLDIILKESEISEPNSSMNILHEKYLNPITNEEREEYFSITDGIVSLGVQLGYFKYLSKETDWFELTEKGILAKSKGGHFKYLEFIEKRESEKTKPTIIAENYIGGDNHGIQASKSSIHKPKIHNVKNNNQQKTSLLEKVSWIIGIVGGLILIYEFLIKKG